MVSLKSLVKAIMAPLVVSVVYSPARNTSDLEQKLGAFLQYYNNHRVHTALDGETPSEVADKTTIYFASLNNIHWKSHCRDLYQLPVAA